MDLFAYLGRTKTGGSAPCSDALCGAKAEEAEVPDVKAEEYGHLTRGGCGRAGGRHETPPNWLKFENLQTRRSEGIGIVDGAIDGGVRDAVNAWPRWNHYVYRADGKSLQSSTL